MLVWCDLHAARNVLCMTISRAVVTNTRDFTKTLGTSHKIHACTALASVKFKSSCTVQPILKISKFTCISSASLPACQPAIRPGCARCRAPEISHNKSNGGGFTKMLFRRRFTHCTHGDSFYPLFPSLFFYIPLARCESHRR